MWRWNMSNKQLFVVAAYLLIFGGFGFVVGYSVKEDQQQKINENLKVEYDELKTNYDILEIQYNRDLEACYIQLGDMQDDYDVNNDGVVNAVDYVAIKNYIMSQTNE